MGKAAYRVRNWREYNQALVSRGNLTIWWNEGIEQIWYADLCKGPKPRGRPLVYSDRCIELALTIRSLFHFPLRATQGFLEGFFKLLHLELEVPHYSRLSRRAAGLKVKYHSNKARKNPVDLVVDSTGLKVYGEGEWKIKVHGKAKRRTWRKLHLAINPKSFETVSLELTEHKINDDKMMPDLLKNKKRVRTVYADGAYISKKCFDAISKTGAKAKIALRTGIGLVKKKPSPGQKLRNNLVKEIWKSGGRIEWKRRSGYHKRSLIETHFYRFKTIFGSKLSCRTFVNQVIEAKIKTKILNRMTSLGMPDSYKVP